MIEEKVALLNSRTVFRFLLKLSKVGLFLSQVALSPLMEFHRFAEALAKLLDQYFPGGTISKFNSADHRTLRGTYGTTN